MTETFPFLHYQQKKEPFCELTQTCFRNIRQSDQRATHLFLTFTSVVLKDLFPSLQEQF